MCRRGLSLFLFFVSELCVFITRLANRAMITRSSSSQPGFLCAVDTSVASTFTLIDAATSITVNESISMFLLSFCSRIFSVRV